MKIYLVPFLLDFILFMVQARLADAAGREMHLSNAQNSALLIAFSVVYFFSCPLVSFLLQRRSAKTLLLGAIAAILLLGVPLFFTVNFWPSLLLIGALGAAAAFAFNAFQALIRGKTGAGDMAKTVAKYNFAWSIGIGLGFLLGGVFRTLHQPILLAASCSLAICGIFWMIWGEKPAPLSISSTRSSTETDAEAENAAKNRAEIEAESPRIGLRDGDARYVAIGWSLCAALNFIQRPLAAYLPKFNAQMGVEAWMAGGLLCALLWSQALGGYLIYRKSAWLYRRAPLVILQLGIIAAIGVLWISRSYVVSLAAMIALGAMHGFAIFCSVFYCSNSANSARDVGFNEMSVGVGNVSSMLICTWAIQHFVSDAAFYPTMMLFSALLLLVQMWWLRRPRAVMLAARETVVAR